MRSGISLFSISTRLVRMGVPDSLKAGLSGLGNAINI